MICFVFFLDSYFRWTRRKTDMDLKTQDLNEKINLVQVDAARETQAIQACNERIANYSYLKEVTEQLCLCFTLEETLRTFSFEAGELFGHREVTVIIYLFDPQTGELGLVSSQKGQNKIVIKEKRGDLYDQWVVKNRKPLLVEDTRSDFRFEEMRSGHPRPIRSLMGVPLSAGHKAIGVLRVDSPKENYFTTADMRLFTTVADLGAVAIENAQLYEQIEDLAVHDGLTGLHLRRYLSQILSREVSRQLRQKGTLSFLMVDLDRFKQYNDMFGHTAGDILLRTVARILTSMFHGPGNVICRYGGEEFAVLLPDCAKEQALGMAEAFRRKIQDEIVILRREKTQITVSVGVASLPQDAQIKDELIQKADEALYQAKRKGRNRVCGAA